MNLFKGMMYWLNIDKEGNVLQSRCSPNKFVRCGRAYFLDMALGRYNWRDPGNDSLTWGEMDTIWLHMGDSEDTNAGVVGPADGTPVADSGAWQGVADADWKLSNDLYQKDAVVTRDQYGTVVEVSAVFTDSELGSGEVEIYEGGIFLDETPPSADPLDSDTYKPYAMLTRSVLYDQSGGYYSVAPLTRAAGTDIKIIYPFGDLGY